jgi:predicted dehydrogenase
LQIIPGKLVEVSGYAWENHWATQPGAHWPKDANEDEAQLVARFSGGQRVNLQITSLDVSPERGFMKIVGTRGTHLMDWGEFETSLALPEGGRQIHRAKHPASEGEKFYRNIVAHLTTGEPLVITGEWARRPIHILDLAVRSARANRALPAEYP